MQLQKKMDLQVSKRSSWKNYYDEEIKYLKESEIMIVLNNIKNEFHKMLFLFLFETGARVSEILQIKISDIDFKYNKVKLITLKRQNKKVIRVLTISNSLMNKVLLYEKKKSLLNSDYLFSKKTNGKPISVQAVNKAVKKDILNFLGSDYADLAHPHTLRHSRAVQLLNAGVNIVHVKSILGHANIINTLIYLKYSNKDLQESIKKANNALGIN